tara:strand:- start:2602 stop:3279 length:678 start_codon:yes stop_codon:yes gene_type:complete
MIPVRKGSQRVKGKALRKIGRITLLEQTIKCALTYFQPSDIYLNTNWDELKNFTKDYKINFYRRDDELASSSSTNDEFMNDFLLKSACKRVVQLLPTSPYLLSEELRKFCNVAIESSNKTIISVASHRIASVLEDGTPLNFSRDKKNPPSQTMKAIYSYVGVLMSWDRKTFLEQYYKNYCAYHGNENNIYFPLRFLSQLDIDTETDLKEAQLLSKFLPIHTKFKS